MVDKNENHGKLKRRGYLKGLAATGVGAGALTTATGRLHAQSDDGQKVDDTAREIDGDSVYLIFGVDPSSTELDSWVETHEEEITTESHHSSTQVIQYQNVSQLNINQQGNAVGIAIDGGEATSIQQTDQNNSNTQEGSARSINAEKETNNQTFTGPTNAYIVFAEETECREFAGWVVREETYQSSQSAEATVDQTQAVDQFNHNQQSTAVAVAEGGSCSQAYQQSIQENENFQGADAVAATLGGRDSQTAASAVEQSQQVSQLNVNEQGIAIAIAVGDGSTAEARQLSTQSNLNEQVATTEAITFDSKSVDEVTATTSMTGDFPKGEMTRSKAGSSQSNTRAASADITQVQSVGQENFNLQNAAIAIGFDDSRATARQASYQGNFNAQVASADALNVKDSHRSARAVVNGTDLTGDKSWAVAYENGAGETEQQIADAEIDQLQSVGQLNVNEQFGAIAFARESGDAVAEQLNYQVNENLQVAEASSANSGTNSPKNATKNSC